MKRRSLLRGLGIGAGASVLGPFLSRVVAGAQGAPAPKRLILMVEGDSLHPRRTTPPEVLANLNRARREADPSANDVELDGRFDSRFYSNETPLVTEGLTLPRALEPLTPHRDDLLMVQGLSNRVAGGGHTGNYGSLSCAAGARRVPGGITIDQYLGLRHPTNAPFRTLAVGTRDLGVIDGQVDPRIERFYATSAYGPANPAPILVNPTATYRSLFGSVSSDPRQFSLESDLLDTLNADLVSARSALAGPERATLDAYAGSVETLMDRRSQLLEMEDTLRRNAPVVGDTFTSPHPLVRLEAQCDLASAALISGLTNIVLVASGTSDDAFSVHYTSLGADFPEKHPLGHGDGYQGQTNNYWLGEIHHRHATLAARMIDSLKAMPEGDGTMWDNTMMIYTCDGGERHHASFRDWVAVLLGGRNIPLNTAAGGRSVLYPGEGSDRHRQLSNLWNTVAHVLDMPEDEFGGEAAAGLRIAPGPLGELLR